MVTVCVVWEHYTKSAGKQALAVHLRFQQHEQDRLACCSMMTLSDSDCTLTLVCCARLISVCRPRGTI